MGFYKMSEEYYTRWYDNEPIGDVFELADINIMFAYELMERAGYLPVVFYDREDTMTQKEFLAWAKDPSRLFFVQHRNDGTPISLCWLTGRSETGRQAFAHFSTLGTGTVEECLVSGRQVIHFIGRLTGIHQLIGLTPACYRHALTFAYGLGFKKLTTLKEGVMCRGKARDAVLSLRDTKGEEDGSTA